MTLPTTMRAATIDRFGEAEELKLQEVAVPTPGPDELLIKAVRAGGRVAHPNGVQPAPTGGPNADVIAFDGVASRAVIDRLNALIESRPFAVEISGRFALADVAKAHLALKDHRPGRPIVAIG